MQEDIKYGSYNKVEDTIYYLGSNAVLKMNVSLYTNSEKYGRRSYYQELQYYNEKVGEKVINIKRNFDFFASIENLKPINGKKEYIMLHQHDIFLLRRTLNQLFKMFNEEFDNMFVKRNGIVTIRNKIKPIEVSGLALGKYLVFSPDISEFANGDRVACVRMNLASPHNAVLLTESKLCGFLECVNNMDMFGYAQNILNFHGRPAYGTNMYDMSSKQDIEDKVIAKPGRKIQTKAKSYFANKMAEIE